MFKSYLSFCIVLFLSCFTHSMEEGEGTPVSLADFQVEVGEMGRKFENKVYKGFSDQTKARLFEKDKEKQKIKNKITGLYHKNSEKYDQLMVKKATAKMGKNDRKKTKKDSAEVAYIETQLALQKETEQLRELILADLASEERRANKRLKCKFATALVSGGFACAVALIEAGVFTATWFLTEDDTSSGC